MSTITNNYKINKQLKFMVGILILIIIAGCGFHLRGAVPFPTWFKSVYITPDDPYEPLQKNIRRAFARNKITVVTEISKETAILELTTPDFTESILALNASGQAQRFRLTITFQYKLSYASNVLRPFTNIQSTRDFSIAPGQILSGDNERRLIKDELLQEAISQLFRQLSTVTVPE